MNAIPSNAQAIRETLASTLPDSYFTVEGIKECVYVRSTTQDTPDNSTSTMSESDGEFIIHRPHLSSKDPTLFDNEGVESERYTLEGVLGTGGVGKVYAFHDNNLNRDVAVKCLKEKQLKNNKKVKSFIQEARITASLEHSGVLPVLDLDFNEDGEMYYAMRRVQGQSLNESIARAKHDPEAVPEICTINDRINLIIKVCETIEYAHRRGILHRDIKPENIMLGELGEVFVVDWGTALELNESGKKKIRRVGTPLFMSPEQARREQPGVQDDVYALGATLFQLLTYRFPMYTENLDVFWHNKRNGIIDLPDTRERSLIPDQLMAIVLKALEPEAKNRYQSAQEFIKDLRNFQSGLAVSAAQDSLRDFMSRWYRRNKKSIMVALVMLIPLVAVLFFSAVMLASVHKERSRHWNMVYEDRFERKEPGDKWKIDAGQAVIIDDQLVISGSAGANARLLIPHGPNVRIEFMAKIADGGHVSDISTYMFTSPGKIDSYYEPDGYLYAFGTGNNSFSAIRRSGHIMARREDVLIKPGKWYHIVCERDGKQVRLLIDGQEIFSIQDQYPPRFDEAMFAQLYTWKSVMHVQYVRLYTKTIAERERTIDIADEFFSSGQYVPAARLYDSVWRSHRDTDLGFNALYGLSLCNVEQGHYNKAVVRLQAILDNKKAKNLHLLAQLKIAEVYMTRGDVEAGIAAAEKALQKSDNPKKNPEIMMFFDDVFSIVKSVPDNTREQLHNLDRFCEWWLSAFPEHYTVSRGRMFDIWAIIHRRCGDWDGHERIIQKALTFPSYKGGTASLKRMLFDSEWRHVWNNDRIKAAAESSLNDLYVSNLFYANKLEAFKEEYEKYRSTTDESMRNITSSLYKQMLESQGQYVALKNAWGSAVHTRAGKESLSRCLLAAGEPQKMLQLLEPDWAEVERPGQQRQHPIGTTKWKLAFIAYSMLGDRASQQRILAVAQMVNDRNVPVKGTHWFQSILSDEQSGKEVSRRRNTWPETQLDDSYLLEAEAAFLNGNREGARQALNKCLELPYSSWDAIAQRRLRDLQ